MPARALEVPSDYERVYLPFPPGPTVCEDHFTVSPHPYQIEFCCNQAPVKGAVWGVGTGKTVVLVYDHVKSALEYPGMLSVYGAPTYTMLDDTVVPVFEALFDLFEELNGFPLYRSWQITKNRIKLYNGSTILLRSADKPNRWRGTTIGKCTLDECSTMPNEEDILDIVTARLRGRGPRQLAWGTTPMGDVGIVGKMLARRQEGDPDVWISHKTSYDNPSLPPGYIERMKRSMSKEMFEQECLAQIRKITGLVFAAFDRDRHVVKWDPREELRPGGWTVVIGVDWGYEHAHAIYVAIRRNPELPLPEMVVFDEFELRNQSDEAMVREIVSRLNRWPTIPRAICPDAAGIGQNKDLRIGLRKLGLGIKTLVEPDYSKRQLFRSIELVRRWLELADGTACLHFSDNLFKSGLNAKGGTGILEAMEHYARKKDRTGKSYTDTPVDDNWWVHSIDAFRYVLLNLGRLGFPCRIPESSMQRAIVLEESA